MKIKVRRKHFKNIIISDIFSSVDHVILLLDTIFIELFLSETTIELDDDPYLENQNNKSVSFSFLSSLFLS